MTWLILWKSLELRMMIFARKMLSWETEYQCLMIWPFPADKDIENLKQYLRRDILQIHGVPATTEENTNDIVKQVVHLIDPEVLLDDTDILISHRLSSNEGYSIFHQLSLNLIGEIYQIWVSNKILVSISMRALS